MSGKEAQILLMLEIVSPTEQTDVFKLSRNERDTIYNKFKKNLPWNDVFSQVECGETRDKLIDLFGKLDDMHDGADLRDSD